MSVSRVAPMSLAARLRETAERHSRVSRPRAARGVSALLIELSAARRLAAGVER